MGGSSKSSSSSSQSTTTRDERIAATDNATVVKDSFQNLTSVTTLDAGAISSNRDITLAVLANAQESVQGAYDAAGGALDKFTEFLTKANEKSTTETTGATKLAPYLLIGVSVVALSMSLKK
jgi:hypothetical protein